MFLIFILNKVDLSNSFSEEQISGKLGEKSSKSNAKFIKSKEMQQNLQNQIECCNIYKNLEKSFYFKLKKKTIYSI